MARSARVASTTAAVGITLDDGKTLLSIAESLMPHDAAYWIMFSLKFAAVLLLAGVLVKSTPVALGCLAMALNFGGRILDAGGRGCAFAGRGLHRIIVNTPITVGRKIRELGRDVARVLAAWFGAVSEFFKRRAGRKSRRRFS
jgi:hypothetical protein